MKLSTVCIEQKPETKKSPLTWCAWEKKHRLRMEENTFTMRWRESIGRLSFCQHFILHVPWPFIKRWRTRDTQYTQVEGTVFYPLVRAKSDFWVRLFQSSAFHALFDAAETMADALPRQSRKEGHSRTLVRGLMSRWRIQYRVNRRRIPRFLGAVEYVWKAKIEQKHQ